jgi:ribonuclease Z
MPRELELHAGGLTLHGTSMAARATAFAVPELGVALDVGRMGPLIAAQPVVLLSHGHLDHLSGVLAYLNVRARFHREAPPRLFAPRETAERLAAALELMPGMESVRKRVHVDEAIVGVEAGAEVELAGGVATAFALDHGVPALGWALRWTSGARPALVFAADSTVAPFEAEPELLDADTAIVECTFVESGRRVAARLSRHAHITDWVGLAPRLACDRLVLAHLPEVSRERLADLVAPLAAALRGELVLWAHPS